MAIDKIEYLLIRSVRVASLLLTCDAIKSKLAWVFSTPECTNVVICGLATAFDIAFEESFTLEFAAAFLHC